jgi:hypothetical protein
METCKSLFLNELELVPLAGLEPATQGLGILKYLASSNRGKYRFPGVNDSFQLNQ